MTYKNALTLHLEMEILIVNMKHGKQKLLLNMLMNILNIFDKFIAYCLKKFWHCEQKSECKSLLHMNAADDSVIKQLNKHKHSSDVAQC